MRARRSPPSPAWLVVGSVVSVQAGQALGRQMFDTVAPATVVMLRLVLAAVVLVLWWRPRFPRRPSTLALTLGLGTAIAGMNLVYPALAHLPLGVAVSLQLLGPLTVAVVGSRRLRDLGWAVLAGGGVAMFYGPGSLSSAVGVALALLSGAAMGAYVVLNKRTGTIPLTGPCSVGRWSGRRYSRCPPASPAPRQTSCSPRPCSSARRWRCCRQSFPTPSTSRRCAGYRPGPSQHWRASNRRGRRRRARHPR